MAQQPCGYYLLLTLAVLLFLNAGAEGNGRTAHPKAAGMLLYNYVSYYAFYSRLGIFIINASHELFIPVHVYMQLSP